MRFAIVFDPETNSPEEVYGQEELRQAIMLRLLERKGDWIFDRDFGLPWLTDKKYGVYGILGSAPPMPPALIEAFIREEIAKEKRVARIRDLIIYYVSGERHLLCEFAVVPINEDPFRIRFSL